MKYELKTIKEIKEFDKDLYDKIIDQNRYFYVYPFMDWLSTNIETALIEEILKENQIKLDINKIEIDMDKKTYNFHLNDKEIEKQIFNELYKLFEYDQTDDVIFDGLRINEYLFDKNGYVVTPFEEIKE